MAEVGPVRVGEVELADLCAKTTADIVSTGFDVSRKADASPSPERVIATRAGRKTTTPTRCASRNPNISDHHPGHDDQCREQAEQRVALETPVLEAAKDAPDQTPHESRPAGDHDAIDEPHAGLIPSFEA